MFRILDIMHLDMANAQIQQLRPYLKQQSINYEKKKFEDFIAQQQGNWSTTIMYLFFLTFQHLDQILWL